MNNINRIIDRNRQWANRIKEANPSYFDQNSLQQNPDILWIGCSDSRLPVNQILDLPSGEVFVHRNIANLVVPSDLNCLSVLQFAVEVLGVINILVCGHYGCGGIRAAMTGSNGNLIDNWLNHIRLVHRLHARELPENMLEEKSLEQLAELNVIEQVNNVCRTTIVQNAWSNCSNLQVYGVIYDMKKGILSELCRRDS
ncbi:carbonic anhydrase family protein [Candidatus Endolissoclinum faulkneri L2]|uniref:Carbonic anhydrase n=1 Tax=Candidatus Endolissoclinum faulkneri L2 TaxID=1193729 RepID=K7YP76_9PROT|nr:carbonic anhydrase [Candidatus Endolissoclinum faulkneri]AFX99337.1 carbonic anhydrase family protein [Candidatus Endolissoclinum faulkneri L2]